MKPETTKEIREILAHTYEEIFRDIGDTNEIRLLITRFTLGYMGASYGLYIEEGK